MNSNQTFKQNLLFWTKHCSINALPSFVIALIFLQLWSQPINILAMLLAVLTFIVLYAVFTHKFKKFRNGNSLLAKSLSIALKIRIFISILSLLITALASMIAIISTSFDYPFFLLFVPDFWAGMLASSIFKIDIGKTISFTEVYLITITEGLILSAFLFLIVFLSLGILKLKSRKKASA